MHTSPQQQRPPQVHLAEVNLGLLDTLVLQYLVEEDLVEVRACTPHSCGAVCVSCAPTATLRLLCVCAQVRPSIKHHSAWLVHPAQDGGSAPGQAQLVHRLAALAAFTALHAGQVGDALSVVCQYCPAVLEVRRGRWTCWQRARAHAPGQTPTSDACDTHNSNCRRVRAAGCWRSCMHAPRCAHVAKHTACRTRA
jgi:hypothetical protein